MISQRNDNRRVMPESRRHTIGVLDQRDVARTSLCSVFERESWVKVVNVYATIAAALAVLQTDPPTILLVGDAPMTTRDLDALLCAARAAGCVCLVLPQLRYSAPSAQNEQIDATFALLARSVHDIVIECEIAP